MIYLQVFEAAYLGYYCHKFETRFSNGWYHAWPTSSWNMRNLAKSLYKIFPRSSYIFFSYSNRALLFSFRVYSIYLLLYFYRYEEIVEDGNICVR